MADQKKIAALRDLIETKKELSKEILKVANEAFPIGARVIFDKWGGRIDAIIKNQRDWGDPRFFVKNLNTGNEYWVDLYDLLYRGE